MTRRDQPFSPIDMHEILGDVVEITRSRWKTEAERRNVEIRIELDCRPVPRILGNATELREVFTNLVLNSVDAMPQGGTIHLRCHAEGGMVRVEVEDTGVGMTDEIRRHLFDPSFTTKGLAGNGLGMSVAYGIVTRHEGSIDVTTAMGLGTKFTMEFPSQSGEVVVAGNDGAAMPRLVRPGRILVIDDEPPIAQLLEDALSAEGHSVEVAVSGREGVQMAEMAEFDLVLSDLGMPDMSGWEVASRIHKSRPGTPVVLVTGWGTTLNNDEVERSGVRAVVHKPFEIKDLLETTHRVLAESLPPEEESSS